jgi:protein-tyrosine-phosphatase
MWMRRVHPTAAPRTATLKRLVRDLPDGDGPLFERLARLRVHEVQLEPGEDVVDPAGGDLDVFLDCAQEIADLLHQLIPRLH